MCPFCGENNYKKNGHYQADVRGHEQMYRCKTCDRHFTDELDKKFEKKPELNQAIVELRSKGFSQREMAKKLGCARWTVQLKLKKYYD